MSYVVQYLVAAMIFTPLHLWLQPPWYAEMPLALVTIMIVQVWYRQLGRK